MWRTSKPCGTLACDSPVWTYTRLLTTCEAWKKFQERVANREGVWDNCLWQPRVDLYNLWSVEKAPGRGWRIGTTCGTLSVTAQCQPKIRPSKTSGSDRNPREGVVNRKVVWDTFLWQPSVNQYETLHNLWGVPEAPGRGGEQGERVGHFPVTGQFEPI